MKALKMKSRTVLLALCVLAMVLLVHCDEPRQHQQQQHHPRPVRSNLRYKRMYVMCPPKFSRIGNECYYMSPNKLNWLDAYFDCKDHNSKLAEPMKYEDKHLRRYLQKIQHHEDLWIGGTYNWKSNKWQWGHNGREMDYQSFSQMVPGSSRDLKFNCALLRADLKFRWSAEECTKKINFICQHRMPLVSETSRNQVYSRWNETFPNQKANEKLVYIVSDPNNRNRTDMANIRIYNSMKQVFKSNPSIQPRPASHRRKQNRGRKHQQQPVVNNRTEYFPADVVYRKQQVAQYAPETHNENSVDNGHSPRNGYSVPRFNVDFTPRNGRNRDASFARNGYPRESVGVSSMNQPHPQYPHQHRHQSGMYSGPSRKTTKHMQQQNLHYYSPNTPPPFRPPPPTTTTTTTTTTPAPTTTSSTTTTTHRPTTTTAADSYPRTDEPTTVYAPITSAPKRLSAMSPEEKKIQRELLRERLRRLSPEEQQFFFQDRARRKRLKEQQLRKLKEQQQDNEVVHE